MATDDLITAVENLTEDQLREHMAALDEERRAFSVLLRLRRARNRRQVIRAAEAPNQGLQAQGVPYAR